MAVSAALPWNMGYAPGVPPAPQNLRMKDFGLDYIEFEWNIEEAELWSPLSGSVVECKQESGLFWSQLSSTTSASDAEATGPFLARCGKVSGQDLPPSSAGRANAIATRSKPDDRKLVSRWNAIVAGLKPNTNYKLRVSGLNNKGQGQQGDVLAARTLSVPFAPCSLVCVQREATALNLEWQVTNNRKGPVEMCEVQYHVVDAMMSRWHVVEVPLPDGAYHDECIWGFGIEGLTRGTRYNVRIRACNAAGWSDFSTICAVRTLPLPVAPSEVRRLKCAKNRVSLEILVADPDGAPVIACEIEHRRKDDKGRVERSLAAWRASPGDPLWHANILGLPPKTIFLIRVRAMNCVGWSPYCSDTLELSTPADTDDSSVGSVYRAGEAIGPRMKGLPDSERPLRILCFDSGGVKGLNTIWMMKHLEARLGGRIPWERYDLIAGTSIGGIIATDIALGLRTTGEQFEELLWAIWRHLIAPCKSFERVYHGFSISRERLEAFGDGTCPRNNAYRFPFDTGIPCFVTTARCRQDGHSSLHLIRNYPMPEGAKIENGKLIYKGRHLSHGSFGTWSLRDAKLATAAAPTYMERHTVMDHHGDDAYYIDGCVYAANPTSLAIFEAKHLWPHRRIGSVHSFGCGAHIAECCSAGGEHNAFEWFTKVGSMFLDCDAGDRSAQQLLELVEPDVSYVRLQTPATHVEAFETNIERLADMKMKTARFLESGSLRAEFEQVVEDLGCT